MAASDRIRNPRRLLRIVTLLATATLCGLLTFAVSAAVVRPGGDALRALTPTVPVATPTSTVAPQLADVARASLSRTVTVEVMTAGDEQLGTGWLVDSSGDFVTNAHVVSGAISIRLRDRGGNTHVGRVLGANIDHDVAVIRSEDGFAGVPLSVADTDAVLEQRVVAIASSRATGHGDVTVEQIKDLGVEVNARDNPDVNPSGNPVNVLYHAMIEIRGAVIYQGNSGGPLLDDRGDVVGIVTLASKTSPAAYAIPVSRVRTDIAKFTAIK